MDHSAWPHRYSEHSHWNRGKEEACLPESLRLLFTVPDLHQILCKTRAGTMSLCSLFLPRCFPRSLACSRYAINKCVINRGPDIILALSLQTEPPADLVSVGFTEVKKGALDSGGGPVTGPGEPVWASPISAPEPLPVPSQVPCFSSLPPERQVSTAKEVESEMRLSVLLAYISKWAFWVVKWSLWGFF